MWKNLYMRYTVLIQFFVLSVTGVLGCKARGPFLETPDNFPGPKTILGAQYSPIAIQFFIDFES